MQGLAFRAVLYLYEAHLTRPKDLHLKLWCSESENRAECCLTLCLCSDAVAISDGDCSDLNTPLQCKESRD